MPLQHKMTVKNDFSAEQDFATWRFSKNSLKGSEKIVLNRHFVLPPMRVYAKPRSAEARSAAERGSVGASEASLSDERAENRNA